MRSNPSPIVFATVLCVIVHNGTFAETPAAPTGETAAKPAPAPDAAEMEAFFTAAMEGGLEKVKQALTKPGAATYADPDGRTALMLAAFNGHTETVELLLKSGAKTDARDKTGRTALMYASSGPNVATVAALVKSGAGVNLADGGEHWTPLMFAAAEGQVEVARALLAAGADPSAADIDGEDSIMFATSRGFKQLAEMITQAKANAGKPAK